MNYNTRSRCYKCHEAYDPNGKIVLESNELIVRGVQPQETEEDITAAILQVVPSIRPERVRLARDRFAADHKGFGFITYANVPDAKKVLESARHQLTVGKSGPPLRLGYANKKLVAVTGTTGEESVSMPPTNSDATQGPTDVAAVFEPSYSSPDELRSILEEIYNDWDSASDAQHTFYSKHVNAMLKSVQPLAASTNVESQKVPEADPAPEIAPSQPVEVKEASVSALKKRLEEKKLQMQKRSLSAPVQQPVPEPAQVTVAAPPVLPPPSCTTTPADASESPPRVSDLKRRLEEKRRALEQQQQLQHLAEASRIPFPPLSPVDEKFTLCVPASVMARIAPWLTSRGDARSTAAAATSSHLPQPKYRE